MATGTNTQVFDGALKDDYEDFVADGVSNKNKFKEIFKAQQIPHGGRSKKFTTHVGRNAGVMASGEDGGIAAAGAQKYVQSEVRTKKVMGRVRYTQEILDDSMGDENSFVDARKDEMNRLIDDFARKEEHYWCSLRGILAYLSGDPGTDADEVELDNPGGFTHASFGNRFVARDMFVGAVNPSTGALRAGVVKVSSVNSDGTGFTPDASINAAWADNDYLVQCATSATTDVGDSSFEQAPTSILELIDDGTYKTNYFSVDRDIYETPVNAYVKATTGALSFDVLQQASDVADQRLGGRIDKLVMHHSTRRLYIQLTEADRRYSTSGSLRKPDGGTAAFQQEEDLTMGNVPIIAIRDFPLDVIVGLDSANMGAKQYVSEKGRWVDDDGSILVRDGTGNSAKHAFEAWYFRRHENYVAYPAKCIRLDGVTGQSLVVVRSE
jgi:hypothetical protein